MIGVQTCALPISLTRTARPTPGQRALADQLARGESLVGGGIETLPASVYLDPDRFAREQATLFARMPLLLGPSALLPEGNHAATHDGYGVPLILSRDRDGAGHVLANVCRHRGTRLIETDEVIVAPITSLRSTATIGPRCAAR